MSIEALNEFFKNMDTNEQLSKDFDALEFDAGDINQKVVDLARSYNYDFSVDELETVIKAAKVLRKEALDAEK